MLKLAVADSDCAAIASHFVGPTSVAISYGDPVGLAKILSEFADENEVFELKAGVVDGEAMDPAQISVLVLQQAPALSSAVMFITYGPGTLPPWPSAMIG